MTAGRSAQSHTGAKQGAGESRCLDPFCPVLLRLLRSENRKQALIPEQELSLFSFCYTIRDLFDYEPQHSSTTRTLRNIFRHSTVTWHCSFLGEREHRMIHLFLRDRLTLRAIFFFFHLMCLCRAVYLFNNSLKNYIMLLQGTFKKSSILGTQKFFSACLNLQYSNNGATL